MMVETFYLHLEFIEKNGGWSINLPFVCSKCGACCTLEDFLTAGEINAKPQEHPEVHAKIKTLFEELGKKWEADESEYDKYVQQNPCPFLVDKSCSIYELRPEGCRLFPKTAFGMLTQDCEPLNRFKRIRSALKKGIFQRNLSLHRYKSRTHKAHKAHRKTTPKLPQQTAPSSHNRRRISHFSTTLTNKTTLKSSFEVGRIESSLLNRRLQVLQPA